MPKIILSVSRLFYFPKIARKKSVSLSFSTQTGRTVLTKIFPPAQGI